MVRVAELLADLTLLKTINSSEALTLVCAPQPQDAKGQQEEDRDFLRAMEFLALRSEQIRHEELDAKRKAVAKVVARLRGEVVVEQEAKEGEEEPVGRRMAGGWA